MPLCTKYYYTVARGGVLAIFGPMGEECGSKRGIHQDPEETDATEFGNVFGSLDDWYAP